MAHDVLRLQIQMHHVLAVHVGNPLAYLPHEQDAVLLGEGEVVGDHPLEQLPARDVLHHHDGLLLTLEGGGQLQELRVAQLVHDADLVADLRAVLGRPGLDELGGELLGSGAVDHLMDDAETAFAHLLLDVVELLEVVAGFDGYDTGLEGGTFL